LLSFVSEDSRSIHVWDLRAIRRRLAEMDLDWNLPSYPLSDTTRNPRPLKLSVDLGDFGKDEKK
jgi:hypothetical protein